MSSVSASRGAAMDSFLGTFAEGADATGMLDFLAEDIVFTDWMLPGEDLHGKATVVERVFVPITESFPDVHFDVLDARRAEDVLLVRGFFIATFARDYMGFPAHGRRVRWEARDMYRFRGEEIDRIWFANDTLTVARELGAEVGDDRLWRA